MNKTTIPTQYALTEDEVIAGVVNYLKEKGRTIKSEPKVANAKKHEKGIDFEIHLGNNRYFGEAKGNVKSDGEPMKSKFDTNFRWAISQIILRIKTAPNNYADNYCIAMPDNEIEKCKKLVKDNIALKTLKIRFYGAYRKEDGTLYANEYTGKKIYTGTKAR
jgi:hypothetical protein